MFNCHSIFNVCMEVKSIYRYIYVCMISQCYDSEEPFHLVIFALSTIDLYNLVSS